MKIYDRYTDRSYYGWEYLGRYDSKFLAKRQIKEYKKYKPEIDYIICHTNLEFDDIPLRLP